MSAPAHPHTTELRQFTQPEATAANDRHTVIGRAPYAGTVTAVTYAPLANITGQATNYRRFQLINRGLDGNGATVVAELLFDSGGVTADDFDEKTITLSATQANRVVAEGDILSWFSDSVGTGIADPGGITRVEITRS